MARPRTNPLKNKPHKVTTIHSKVFFIIVAAEFKTEIDEQGKLFYHFYNTHKELVAVFLCNEIDTIIAVDKQ